MNNDGWDIEEFEKIEGIIELLDKVDKLVSKMEDIEKRLSTLEKASNDKTNKLFQTGSFYSFNSMNKKTIKEEIEKGI